MCLGCLTHNVQHNAAADALGRDLDIIPYEDEDLNTKPDPNPQQQPLVVQVDTGEHGRSWSYCYG
jgi:hypothetical protein